MAIGDPYITVSELKVYKGIAQSNTTADSLLESAVNSASVEIETFCDRQFNKELVATTRRYRPNTGRFVYVDDFYETNGLVVSVDWDGAGVYVPLVLGVDFELLPIDGVVGGRTGFPFYKIRMLRGSLPAHRSSVQVTAKWGWLAVPDTVKQAALIIASETYQLKDAPFGVAGNNQFGEIRVRDNPMARNKLIPFQLHRVKVG